MMKLLQPISFRRIFLTILSAVIVGFVGISIWYFGFTPMGRGHFIQIQNYKEQEQYRKNDYDYYKNLPLLSGFDRNIISTGEETLFTFPQNEGYTHIDSQTQKTITRYGGIVKIPMQTMMNSSQSGFIMKLVDNDAPTSLEFNIYSIPDTYTPKTYFTFVKKIFFKILGLPWLDKSEFWMLGLGFNMLDTTGDHASSCMQFMNDYAVHHNLLISNLDSDCLLSLYANYGYYHLFIKDMTEYKPYMYINYQTLSDKPLVLSVQKVE